MNGPQPISLLDVAVRDVEIALAAFVLARLTEARQINIAHELTNTGIQKFVADYRSTLRRPA
jgi:hypothetical protein